MLRTVEIDGIFAICWRRTAAAKVSEETLRRQHQAVVDVARRVRSILPVRFGALIEKDQLVERVHNHQEVLRAALEEVRDCVQMTVRVFGDRPAGIPVQVSSGRQYLEGRQRALDPVLPANAQAFLQSVRRLVLRERLEPGAAGLLATIYHLLPSDRESAYSAAVPTSRFPNLIVSGPWPPFAFTPQLW